VLQPHLEVVDGQRRDEHVVDGEADERAQRHLDEVAQREQPRIFTPEGQHEEGDQRHPARLVAQDRECCHDHGESDSEADHPPAGRREELQHEGDPDAEEDGQHGP